MVARENQAFLPDDFLCAVALALLFLRDLQMDELLQNVHHTVFPEHFFPKVGRGITVRVGRITLASIPSRAIAALVEGEKAGVRARKLGGHPDLRVVHTEKAQDALVELEADFPLIPVIHPLPLRVVHVLASILVFQFKGKDGNAVQDKHHIHAFPGISAVIPLPVNCNVVFGILRCRRLVQGGFRLEIADAEGDSPVLEPVAQHMDQAVHVTGIVEGRTELPHGIDLVGVGKPRPLFGLGLLDEVQ